MPARATETAAALLAATLLLVVTALVTPIVTSSPHPTSLAAKGTVGGPFSQEQPLHPAQHPLAVEEGEHRRLQYFPISRAERHQSDKDVAAVVESDRQNTSWRQVRYAIGQASALHPRDLDDMSG